MLVLWFVFYGEVRWIDFGTTRTGDRTTETGVVGNQIRLAITLAHLRHCLGADIVSAVKLNILAIASWQGANLVNDVHQHLCAVCRQAGTRHRMLGQDFLSSIGGFHKRHWIGNLDAHRTAYDHRFEILRSHHRTNARPTGSTVEIVHDAGIKNAVFSGEANRGHTYVRVPATVT